VATRQRRQIHLQEPDEEKSENGDEDAASRGGKGGRARATSK
jgi:hypothetical protein